MLLLSLSMAAAVGSPGQAAALATWQTIRQQRQQLAQTHLLLALLLAVINLIQQQLQRVAQAVGRMLAAVAVVSGKGALLVT